MKRGFVAIGLDNPSDPLNVGHVLRAAGCFEANLVVIGGERHDSFRSQIATDTQKTWRHVPVIQTVNLLESTPFGATVVVVEITPDSRSLVTFIHPERAFYIFGPEGGSVAKEIIARVPLVVAIPSRWCLNLAATVNVVLYDRMAKRGA